jgi:hypothetical protein
MKLKMGAQIMLRKNISVNNGLCNGSVGIVKMINKDNGTIVVEFAVGTYSIEREEFSINHSVTRITEEGKIIGIDTIQMIRKQFPFTLSYALTA